jgi:hypothetical protein
MAKTKVKQLKEAMIGSLTDKAKLPRQDNMKKSKRVAKAKDNAEINPNKQAEQIAEVGGIDRIEREGMVLQLDWAIRFPLLKPIEYLVAERGYSVAQANSILHETGGEDDWVLRRTEIQNKVTETVVKRHVDQIAEFNDTFLKASKVGLAKALEMMTKFSIEAVKDSDGKLILDPKTKKPVYRGFRSIDLLNTLSAIKIAQEIYRKGLGINDGDAGMAQLLEKVDEMNQQQRIQINQQVNLTVNPAKHEAEQKLESFVRQMSYDDIRAFVEYHKHKDEAVEVEFKEGNSEKD